MENNHNIQFSHLGDSAFLEGAPGTGKTVSPSRDRGDRLAAGKPVFDPVSFIEPLANMADLYTASQLKKVRWA